MNELVAYTDGGCRGNPGIGGWGFVLIHPGTSKALERAGGARMTTNNQMEMQACIESVRTAPAYKYRSDRRWLQLAQSFLRSQI